VPRVAKPGMLAATVAACSVAEPTVEPACEEPPMSARESPPMADDHKADLDAIVDVLEDAGLIEQFTDEAKPTMRGTERGAQMGRALAIAGDGSDPEAVLAALLNARGPPSPRP